MRGKDGVVSSVLHTDKESPTSLAFKKSIAALFSVVEEVRVLVDYLCVCVCVCVCVCCVCVHMCVCVCVYLCVCMCTCTP